MIMRLVSFETSIPDAPADAAFYAFDSDAELNGATDFISFGESAEDAINKFIQELLEQAK
jgi:hypothetical protein